MAITTTVEQFADRIQSVAITFASPPVAGDLITLFISSKTTSETAIPLPTGYTLAQEGNQSGGSFSNLLCYKIADGTESGYSYTFANSSADWSVIYTKISNFVGTPTIVGSTEDETYLNSVGTSLTLPAISKTGTDEAIALAFASTQIAYNADVHSWSDSFVENANTSFSNSNLRPGNALATKTVSTAQSLSTVFTATDTGGDLYGAMLVVEDGAGGGGGGGTLAVDAVDEFITRVSGNVSVTLSGTYTGTPTAIRRKVIYADDLSTVAGFDWATYIASPAGDAFTGAPIVLPSSTRRYKVLLDFSDDVAVTAETNEFQSCDKYLIYGQSLGQNLSTDGSAVAPNALVKYSNPTTGVLTTPNAGDGAVTMLNALAVSEGIPQIATNTAASGMGLTSDNGAVDNYIWDSGNPDTVRYLEVKAAIAAMGGEITAAIFVQGERDGIGGNNIVNYGSNLAAHFAQLRADTRAGLPIILPSLGRSTAGGATDADWNTVRQAQISVANNDANIYHVTKYDLAIADSVHLVVTENVPFGQRIGNALIANVHGGSADWQAPTVASIAVVSPTQTRITLTHGQGTDFTPTTAITGIELTESGDAYTVSISDVSRESATSILVTHTSSTVTAGRVYYGEAPDLTGIVKDNSTLNLPIVPSTLSTTAPTTSTINITATNTPNGTYPTLIFSPTDYSVIHSGNVTFTSGAASISAIPLTIGTAWRGVVFDNNATPIDGAALVGVTE